MDLRRQAYLPGSHGDERRAHTRLGIAPLRHDPDRYRVRESDASDDRLRGAHCVLVLPFRVCGAHQRRRGSSPQESNKGNRHR